MGWKKLIQMFILNLFRVDICKTKENKNIIEEQSNFKVKENNVGIGALGYYNCMDSNQLDHNFEFYDDFWDKMNDNNLFYDDYYCDYDHDECEDNCNDDCDCYDYYDD